MLLCSYKMNISDFAFLFIIFLLILFVIARKIVPLQSQITQKSMPYEKRIE
jgi:hypothetical protein